MKNKTQITALAALAASVMSVTVSAETPNVALTHPVSERVNTHENQDWQEFRGFHYTDDKRDLPRVLLIGDSISGQYRTGVRDILEGKANVTWLTSCYCVTTENFFKYLEIALDDDKYAVVHINNGLHSLGADLAAYERGLRRAFKMIREKQPKTKIVWTRTTPLENASRMKIVEALNAIADKVVAEVGLDAVDDLEKALNTVPRESRWSDGCHVTKAGVSALETAVVRSVAPFLGVELGAPAEKTAADEAAIRRGEEMLEGATEVTKAAKVWRFTGRYQLDLPAPKEVNMVEVTEDLRFGRRIGSWRLEYDRNGGDRFDWAVAAEFKGGVGFRRVERFPAVTARRFRIVLSDDSFGAAIEAAALYTAVGR